MKDVREKIITEIKEVAGRIEEKLSEYRNKYYKVIPVESKKKICEWLEKSVSEIEILVFYSALGVYLDIDKAREAEDKYNTSNIYNYLEGVVNEILKYYDKSIALVISDMITSIKRKLLKIGYKVETEYKVLISRLSVINNISLYKNEYSSLVELDNILSKISDIDSINSDALVPYETNELYSIKNLLLQLEQNIEIVENIKDSSCVNVILEYIDYMIDWECFI